MSELMTKTYEPSWKPWDSSMIEYNEWMIDISVWYGTWKSEEALCGELGANCITCSYIDRFVPIHNQMSVIHNIFFKYLQTIYLYKAESARRIDAQLNFQYTGCLIWYLR